MATMVPILRFGTVSAFPASSPEVTAVGGTEFNEGSGSYWNATNGTYGGSATGYIPELAWNDTTLSVANGGSFDASGGRCSCLRDPSET